MSLDVAEVLISVLYYVNIIYSDEVWFLGSVQVRCVSELTAVHLGSDRSQN